MTEGQRHTQDHLQSTALIDKVFDKGFRRYLHTKRDQESQIVYSRGQMSRGRLSKGSSNGNLFEPIKSRMEVSEEDVFNMSPGLQDEIEKIEQKHYSHFVEYLGVKNNLKIQYAKRASQLTKRIDERALSDPSMLLISNITKASPRKLDPLASVMEPVEQQREELIKSVY